MNIIGGKYKGRKIIYPKHRQFRPTKCIVREALFNKLSADIYGSSFLDLCAGSGAIGLEAESRGAGLVVCVDKDVRYIKENKSNFLSNVHIIRSDVIRYLKSFSGDAFDIIFFDPVWKDLNIYSLGISLIFHNNILKENGLLIIEHDSMFGYENDDYPILSTHKYGNTFLTIVKNN